MLDQWKGSGIYDNMNYTLIKLTKNNPKEVKGGTCWIGDKNTFIDIIKDIFA